MPAEEEKLLPCPFCIEERECPECGSLIDEETGRCTANCQNVDKFDSD